VRNILSPNVPGHYKQCLNTTSKTTIKSCKRVDMKG
jgi:hypothetical protein